jgi:hypothetical protein
MKDDEFDQLLARANPFDGDTVRRLPVDAAASDLLEDIMTSTEPTPELRPRRRRRTLVLVAAAALVLIALTGVFFPRGNPAAPVSAYGAEVIKVAEANQRLLLDAPGWKVSQVNEFTAAEGEMEFANGKQRVAVHWRPADGYKSYYDDRAHGNTHQPFKLLGQNGTLFRYSQSTDFTTILPVKETNFLEIRAEADSEAAYRELVGKLKPVGVEQWLDAMPASVVKPAENTKAVDGMIEGLPLPAGLDKSKLYQETVADRYQVGARVTGAIACGWLDQWTAAKQSGDKVKVAEAVGALKTSHDWKILKEMDVEGDYPEAVWQYADQVAKNEVPDGYKDGLGC